MNKTLRNKALRDSSRLITGVHSDIKWYSDSYFATIYPIFNDYKIKKNQYYSNNTVNMTPIIDSIMDDEYIVADTIVEIGESNSIEISSSINDWSTFLINNDYYQLLKNIYPNARLYIANNSYSPVMMKEDNTLVAIIMPIIKKR